MELLQSCPRRRQRAVHGWTRQFRPVSRHMARVQGLVEHERYDEADDPLRTVDFGICPADEIGGFIPQAF